MKKPAASKPKRRTPDKADASMSFTKLVAAIQQVHRESAAVVGRVVNTTLTMRNWIIGAYIHHYELNGADRAKYGEAVIDRLADALEAKGLTELAPRTLRQCRQFYSVYPKIWQTVSAKSASELNDSPIWRTMSAKSPLALPASILGTAHPQSAGLAIRESLSPELGAPSSVLVSRISFSHIAELIAIEDPLKRAFYEIGCIRGNWSVRDLKRQIGSLYFERSGLSKDKEKLSKMVNTGVETAKPRLAIRDPYIFEFLGLPAKDAVAESDLEAALVEHLREFLLELGHGFCLEAQQKSIVIGKTRGFVDLVFYHRILKCHALVEYATASMDNQLFVSKYAVELPTKEELQRFLDRHRKELEAASKSRA
jgi:predicted nuclease of restriction endonuclease-like (RecB) superfamily